MTISNLHLASCLSQEKTLWLEIEMGCRRRIGASPDFVVVAYFEWGRSYLKPLYTVELVAVEVKAAIKNRRFPSLGKVQNQIYPNHTFSTIIFLTP